jgi:general secretion pathway protein G
MRLDTHTKSKHGNKLQTTIKPSRSGAFTLIEMLVVICIMMILAGLLMGISPYVWRSAKEAKARANLEKIHKALEEYMLANGSYPYSVNADGSSLPYSGEGTNLLSLVSKPDGTFGTLTNWLEKGTNTLVDPWGHGYVYSCVQGNQQTYLLFSMGNDGKPGTPDDIISGK